MSAGATKKQIAQDQFVAALDDYRQALESKDPWRIMGSSLRVSCARRSHADSREINRVFDEVTAARALKSEPGDPVCCPYCRSDEVRFVNGYAQLTNADLQRDGVAWDFDEWECRGPVCQGRSFFV